MNREIKFRLWHKESKQMFYNTASAMNILIGLGGEVKDVYLKSDITDEMVKSQYTGLKDKNGKEIYESDIVKMHTDKPMVISWSKKFASFVIDREGWMFSHWFGEACNGEDVEVIGNIFENNELLQSK